MALLEVARYLAPYQFSLPVVIGSVLVLVLYFRGLRAARVAGEAIDIGRRVNFLAGFVLCYAVIHTRFDYYAQYLFFMHRLQHLVLHHLAPFLIAVSAPWRILWLGTPLAIRRLWLRQGWHHTVVRLVYGFVQNLIVAPVLFVGLIYFWLTPAVHFDAMLDLTLYHVMNWSMLIDGLLFWWLMLNPKTGGGGVVVSYGVRVVILFLVMVPQIVLGAYIALSGKDLYDVYDVCGRAWPIASATDQQIGGLLTWIPAAMMSVLGILVVVKYMMQNDDRSPTDASGGRELPSPESGQ
jgi:putative membrane protein